MFAAGGGGAEVEDDGSADVVAELDLVASLDLSSWSLAFGEPEEEKVGFVSDIASHSLGRVKSEEPGAEEVLSFLW